MKKSFNSPEFCYEGEKNIVSKHKLKFDGYYKTYFYQEKEVNGERYNEKVTSYNMVFFADRNFILNFSPEYFESAKHKRFGFYNRGTEWGRYLVKNDTIRALVLEPSGNTSMSMREYVFKIMSEDSIKWLFSVNRDGEFIVYDYTKEKDYSMPISYFCRHTDLPDPNKSWMMQKKWFWCDEALYNVWRRNRSR